jgi:hypothetical protein
MVNSPLGLRPPYLSIILLAANLSGFTACHETHWMGGELFLLSYAVRIGISLPRKEEKPVAMNEERRIPAGINWAKMTRIPKVRKKHTPKSPTPLTPPA